MQRFFGRLFAHQGTTNAVIQAFIFREGKIPVQYAHVGIWVSRALSPTRHTKDFRYFRRGWGSQFHMSPWKLGEKHGYVTEATFSAP